MRILYHHRTRGEDAQGIHIRELCRALRGLGHDVRVVAMVQGEAGARKAPRASPAGGARLLGRAIPNWCYELMALAYNVPGFFMLAAVALRRRPDLIYERYSLFAVCGLAVARLLRVPFVLEVNAPLSLEHSEHGGLVFRRLAQRIEDLLCARATYTVVVSGAMARIFESRGVPPERLVIMPNGVDRERFHPTVDGSAVRRDLGLEKRFIVGFVGWIRPWHGVDRLVDAVAALAETCPDLSLLLVGDGPAVADLRARVRAHGIEDRVVFAGSVDAACVPAHVAAMDVAVQPDVTDYASPIKLFEYLATARAIVAPRKPNITEIVTDGDSALLFTPGETDELTACIRRLYAEPGLAGRLAERGARLIDERGYDWRGNAARIVDLLADGRRVEDAA